MKRPDRFSDRELSRLLQGLREDVAAPADFRARVMQRLQAEGLVAAPARAASPAWRERVAAFFTPAKLGLSLSGAAALVLAYIALNAPAVKAPEAPAPQVASVPAAAPHAVIAKVPRKAPVAVAAAPVERAPEQSVELQGQAPAPAAQGRADESAPVSALSVNAASVEPKPTVVVVTPVVPAGKPRTAESEVRNNVVHASRQEAALILFNLQESGRVRVVVYDRLGREVAVLCDEERPAGFNDLRWSGAADAGGMAASGIYEVRITAPSLQARHKILLAK
jgi:hypothetical protein